MKFGCTDASALAVADPHDLLNVDVLVRQRVEFKRIETLACNCQLALPHTLTPLRMEIAEPFELEPELRVDRDRANIAVESDQINFGCRRPASPRLILDAMNRGCHRCCDLVELVGDCGFRGIERRRKAFANQRCPIGAVEEHCVGDVIVPVQRGPDEADTSGLRRRTDLDSFADAAHTPRSVLGATPIRLVDGEIAVWMTDRA